MDFAGKIFLYKKFFLELDSHQFEQKEGFPSVFQVSTPESLASAHCCPLLEEYKLTYSHRGGASSVFLCGKKRAKDLA